MSRSETWKTWEGRVVDGKFPLRQWVGGSDQSAVFLTDKPGAPSAKAAIKLMEVKPADADREVARLRETTKLSHPNLLSTFDAGRAQIDGTPVVYAVMEYAEEDLSQILPQRALNPSEVADMMPPVIDALAYLHGKGLVHGHIKPSNVQAAADQLKLSVDGIGPAGANPVRKRMGVYDAPEAASGNLTAASDVWSLGVTIIAALTQNESSAGTASPGNLAEPFRTITRNCLNIEPGQRCTLMDIHARLQPEGRSVPADPEPEPQSDRNRLPAYVIPLVLVVLALAAWGLFHSRAKETPAQTQTAVAPTEQTPAPPAQTPEKKQPEAAQQKPAPTPAAQPVAEAPKKTDDSKGAVLHQVMPDVSQSAKNTITGTIKVGVRVEVDSSGKVTSAKLKPAGPSKYFAGRALRAAEEWQFTPPAANGEAKASAWLIQFRFRRGSIQTQASPERSR